MDVSARTPEPSDIILRAFIRALVNAWLTGGTADEKRTRKDLAKKAGISAGRLTQILAVGGASGEGIGRRAANGLYRALGHDPEDLERDAAAWWRSKGHALARPVELVAQRMIPAAKVKGYVGAEKRARAEAGKRWPDERVWKLARAVPVHDPGEADVLFVLGLVQFANDYLLPRDGDGPMPPKGRAA